MGNLARAMLMTAAALFAAVACGGSSSPSAPTSPAEEAVFRVAVGGETFHILLRDPARIGEAESLVGAGNRKLVQGRVRRGDGGFNAPWSWHLAPETVTFTELCAEVQDGLPSHLENDLDTWVDDTMFYCPWGGEIVARIR